ncbi:MAG TPA: hypothetical protein VJH97_02855 [Candidatus Nanoarchaeia archaeon]|nr:hypothetical protein [Candidatus Nanoarchaeia archaeon]
MVSIGVGFGNVQSGTNGIGYHNTNLGGTHRIDMVGSVPWSNVASVARQLADQYKTPMGPDAEVRATIVPSLGSLEIQVYNNPDAMTVVDMGRFEQTGELAESRAGMAYNNGINTGRMQGGAVSAGLLLAITTLILRDRYFPNLRLGRKR